MSDFILSCCSTADMSEQFFKDRGINVLLFSYTMDGVTYPDDFGHSIPFDEFYRRIAEGATPTTSQVNVEEYLESFTPYLKEGKDILHVTLSSGLSGTYNSACVAAQMLEERFPGRRVVVVDSLGASSGYGLLMTLAADLRDSGASLEETAQWVMAHRLNVHHWFFSTDLSSYVRGGRISRTAGFAGKLLNICPLLNMDDEGHLIPRTKLRGKKKAIVEIVERMKEHAEGGLNYSGKCYISQSACYEDARKVADEVEAAFPNLDGKVVINSIGTTIGSHTGPGTVALFFVGDVRTH